jgi:hydrogenase nickel incorporation protein HypA/HybF
MHEMSIAQSLIEIITEEMDKHDASVLRSVKLHIGKLTAIVPDSLAFCFEVITKGTPLDGARLDMVSIPLKAACNACGKTFEVEQYVFECPLCKSGDIETIAGKDLSIVEIEVD